MSSKHQIVIARMNLDVVDSHQRQVSLQACPVPASIKRCERAEFSSEKQQVLIAWCARGSPGK